MSAPDERLRTALAFLVIVLLAVPVGGAVWLGIAHGESPCILCWSQRTSMMLIALAALFVVRYGPRPRYIGMLVLLATWGTFMALRHSALHLARDVGQGFSGSILGAHTYVWSWVIHWLVLLVAGVMLLSLRGTLADRWSAVVPRAGTIAMGLLVALAAANAVQAFASTGPPPYIGQSDPVRLSWDPRQWVWSTQAWHGPVSLRGTWAIPTPDTRHVDTSPAHGPLTGLASLEVERWVQVRAPLGGELADIAVAHDGDDARVLAVTDALGVYVLDATFTRVLHRAVVDPGYSVDLSAFAGAAFLPGDTFVAVSTNKSWVMLRADGAADPRREWRHFLETDGTLAEVRRGRFATVRARQMYVQSLAWDADAGEIITVGVPSARHPRLVVSRFDRSDMMLSSEFVPSAGPALALADGRGLGEYVVTGATVRDGVLFAISAAYSTLLAVDLQSKQVVDAWAVRGISDPVGLAVRGGELLVAQRDGRIAVVSLPGS